MKNRNTALFLNTVWPGMGHFAVGRPKRALFFMFCSLVSFTGAVFVLLTPMLLNLQGMLSESGLEHPVRTNWIAAVFFFTVLLFVWVLSLADLFRKDSREG